ncbi:MAG: S41 family peptidase [Lachnospiraceae bacterium]|nr:S41 family peptidase [Lachnospiraceae bacterium]
MPDKKSYWSGVVSGLLIAAFLVCGAFTATKIYTWIQHDKVKEGTKEAVSASVTEQFLDDNTLEKMQLIQETIETYYLDEVDEETLEDGAYEGMLASLGDPYSEYLSIADLTSLMEQTEGVYYGIGAYIGKEKTADYAYVSDIIPGTPAEESDLMSGDIIYAVDGVSVYQYETADIVKLIKGEEGTTVVITVYREGSGEYLDIAVERRKVETPTVEYKMLTETMAYIQITEFDDVTVDQFAEALAVSKESGMQELILDLRGNPGGSLTVVTDIARMLLPEGLIVYTEDKYGEKTEYYCDGAREIKIPLVVLIDGASASASEILAGAIKDYGKGTLVGTTTYGKGIVQRVISISDGTALKLTISNYYTPNGNNIHKVGIEPDEVVEFDAALYVESGTDNQLERAKEILMGQ